MKVHWTMRYESKHSYFKKLSSSLGNYINICHSLTMRHQQLQCYLRLDEKGRDEVSVGPGLSRY